MSSEHVQKKDSVASKMEFVAQNILVVIFGLLPLIFIPTSGAPFEYTKVLVVLVGLFASLVLYSLSVLRSGILRANISYPLCALWVVAFVSVLSSLLSGDFRDSFVGDMFSIHSSFFVAILAFIPTVWMVLRPSKVSVMKVYLLLAVSTLVLVLFHVLRLFFGPEFLSLGLFSNSTSSPVGSWNDLALFLGLTILFSLVVLEQLALTSVGRTLFAIVTILSLGMLSVINFFMVWLVLGLASLILVVYTLGKDRFSDSQLPLIGGQSGSTTSFKISLLVFVTSVVFVIAGSAVGGWINGKTGISYIEVRPSFEATSNITRSVYQESAYLGIGANKFSDAWRLYKNDSINSTPFWNTDFNAGNGYITTFFATTGVLGGLAWTIFLLLYVISGFRRLLGTTSGDKIWYFIGVSSFVSAVYIWGMSIFYVPGAVILLLGALCTGISLYAFRILSGEQLREITVGNNRRAGFILTLTVMLVIVGSVSALYITTRHYSSIYVFNQSIVAMRQGVSVAELEKQVIEAYTLAPNDVFARRIAEYQLSRINSLSRLETPSDEQKKEFELATINGIRFAQEAVRIDAREPANWAIQAGIYSALASLNIEGALDRARESLIKSRELNPKNPLPYLESAVVEARAGNYDVARTYIETSIAMKQNFTEAFYVLSQLEVVEGNVESAIKSTKAVIALEPNNPVRYYQLGVLESSNKNPDGAIVAFANAIALDPEYANARYLLALTYDAKKEYTKAREQLQKVLELNPDNEEVAELIRVIDTDGSLAHLREQIGDTVPEATPTTDEVGTVSTGQATTDSSLVTPVNTAPSEGAPSLNE